MGRPQTLDKRDVNDFVSVLVAKPKLTNRQVSNVLSHNSEVSLDSLHRVFRKYNLNSGSKKRN